MRDHHLENVRTHMYLVFCYVVVVVVVVVVCVFITYRSQKALQLPRRRRVVIFCYAHVRFDV